MFFGYKLFMTGPGGSINALKSFFGKDFSRGNASFENTAPFFRRDSLFIWSSVIHCCRNRTLSALMTCSDRESAAEFTSSALSC
jgi:hypothetical protein